MGRRKMPTTMNFYTYRPTSDGHEPPETNSDDTPNADRMMFRLKTYSGAKRRARRLYGADVVLFECGDFLDKGTWHRIL